MPSASQKTTLRDKALELLSRREHSRLELMYKLKKRGYSAEKIENLLCDFEESGYLSDARFAEEYTLSRTRRGYGKYRIRMELQQRGVASGIIDEIFAAVDWVDMARNSMTRRYGSTLSESERALCRKRLYQKGHDSATIRTLLKEIGE